MSSLSSKSRDNLVDMQYIISSIRTWWKSKKKQRIPSLRLEHTVKAAMYNPQKSASSKLADWLYCIPFLSNSQSTGTQPMLHPSCPGATLMLVSPVLRFESTSSVIYWEKIIPSLMAKYSWSSITCAFNSLGSEGLIRLFNVDREIEERDKDIRG